jgi:hypothetical protein
MDEGVLPRLDNREFFDEKRGRKKEKSNV